LHEKMLCGDLGRCLLSQCTTFLPHDPTAKLSALISRPSVRHVVVLTTNNATA